MISHSPLHPRIFLLMKEILLGYFLCSGIISKLVSHVTLISTTLLILNRNFIVSKIDIDEFINHENSPQNILRILLESKLKGIIRKKEIIDGFPLYFLSL